MNAKIYIIGNLTKDPELTSTPGGVDVCKFTVAVNRRVGQTSEADFYNVTAWRGLAEAIAKYVKKGNKIAVSGDIALRKYTGNDNVQRLSVDVTAQDVEFLTPKQEPAPVAPKPAKPKQPSVFDDDGDIPF